MSRYLNTAVLGAGFVGRVHMEAVSRLGFVQLYGLAEPETEKARRLGEEFRVEKVTGDYRELLADPKVQAVEVCTPNNTHHAMIKEALLAGKHVVSEKPLAISAAQAREVVALARSTGLRNCTFHNLRYYPMVQQMRRMRESGELGDILAVQGTYSQDWLLYDTDWNWRLDSSESGPSRVMADIGSHFCDMAEHVTGLRITSLCADLHTFHKTRRRPKGEIETFASKMQQAREYIPVPIDTEDYGAVIFRMDGGRTRGAYTATQVAPGRKNRLNLEIHGSKASVSWDQERADELWIGRRDGPNGFLVKDPSLMHEAARPFADLPGGHNEGYDDTFKQVLRRFYRSILDPAQEPDYPQFADGLRQLNIVEAELASSAAQAWVDVRDN